MGIVVRRMRPLLCLIKLEDAETGDIDYTDIACRLLDLGSCRCSDYKNRKRQVPDCVVLTAAKINDLQWMPSTCAYRLIHEGKDLAWWHPLVPGDPETVHQAGISVRNRVVPEERGDDPEDPDRHMAGVKGQKRSNCHDKSWSIRGRRGTCRRTDANRGRFDAGSDALDRTIAGGCLIRAVAVLLCWERPARRTRFRYRNA